MRVGIVGAGVVGRATARAFLEHAEEVCVYDVLPERRTHPLRDVLEASLVFLCLPESQVAGFFRDQIYLRDLKASSLVIKSTVPVGTTRALAERFGLTNLCHSPEFLTARCALVDAQMPARNVIGVPRPSNDDSGLFTGDNEAAQTLNVLYHTRFPGVPVHLMSSDESEALKLIQNAFFATKVSFFNEAYSLCEKLGLGWETIREALLADGRIHPSHTIVPGPQDGLRGWGGACLGKDTEAFRDALFEAGLPCDVSQAVLMRNVYDRGRAPPK